MPQLVLVLVRVSPVVLYQGVLIQHLLQFCLGNGIMWYRIPGWKREKKFPLNSMGTASIEKYLSYRGAFTPSSPGRGSTNAGELFSGCMYVLYITYSTMKMKEVLLRFPQKHAITGSYNFNIR